MNLGEKIKKLRTDKGLSQENIYSNQSLVSQIEKGINKISIPKYVPITFLAKVTSSL